ncbi:hypothetical protein HZB78_02200 [Candidatus Collierbacteria bacterium]|nr:hypothetical protein [Candidatus Collierbacteria bacterium]
MGTWEQIKGKMSLNPEVKNNSMNGQNRLETIIGGETDRQVIEKAVDAFMGGIAEVFFPDSLKNLPADSVLKRVAELRPDFMSRAEGTTETFVDIVQEINERAKVLASSEFAELTKREKDMWQIPGQQILTGVAACVDRGIASEAVAGTGTAMGRTLGGDVPVSFIESRGEFVADPSALKKRLIHSARQGAADILEIAVEHTGCGRRDQMLANEAGDGDEIPALGYVFDHLDALAPEFKLSPQEVKTGLKDLKGLWNNYSRNHGGVEAPDGGLLAGVVAKIAQRQAFGNMPEVRMVVPVEIFNKLDGDLIAGVDSLSALTHPAVLEAGGFTNESLQALAEQGLIFSLKQEAQKIRELLPVKSGTRSYRELQENWLAVQTEITDLTQKLWDYYRGGDGRGRQIKGIVDKFLGAGLGQIVDKAAACGKAETIRNRMTHQLFRCLAYDHILDTFGMGHPPGKHLEDHLATGDHSSGAKRHLALGQGDLQRPSASEMYTGYSVLQHSVPGHEGSPVPLMIKVDTDRGDHQPMSTEETEVATSDLFEAFKLWPYMVVGDMIPVLAIRGKGGNGGASRLPLSIVQNLGSLVDLSQGRKTSLAEFAPASNSKGQVVQVPSTSVIEAGIAAGADLKNFRGRMIEVADRFSDQALQKSIKSRQ